MQVNTIDRQTLRHISDRALKALADLEDELGVTFSNGGGQYTNAASGTMKIEIAMKPKADGTDPMKEEFEQKAKLIGVDPSIYRKIVAVNGKRYRVLSLNLNAPKYPINAEEISTGRGVRLAKSHI